MQPLVNFVFFPNRWVTDKTNLTTLNKLFEFIKNKWFSIPRIKTSGKYFVREYENDEEMGGGFFKTIEEAESRVLEYQSDK